MAQASSQLECFIADSESAINAVRQVSASSGNYAIDRSVEAP